MLKYLSGADIFLGCRVPSVFVAHRASCLSEYKRSIAVRHNSAVLVVDATCCGSVKRHRAILDKKEKKKQVHLQCALLVSENSLLYIYLLQE